MAASDSIIPNGGFSTGDGTGWVASNVTLPIGTFGTLPDGSKGFTLNPSSGHSVCTPAFQVTPGRKYKVIFWTYAGNGTQMSYRRVLASCNAAPNITDAQASAYSDFDNGALSTSATYYSYDWIPSAGQNFASICMFGWNSASAPVYIKGIYCVPYVQAAYIDAGAVTAQALAANAVTANSIQAGAITANKLAITPVGATINFDPAMVDQTAWHQVNGTGTITFNPGPSWITGSIGNPYIGCNNGADNLLESVNTYPIDPTKVYKLSAALWGDAGNNRNSYVYIELYDNRGNYINGATTGWGGSKSGYLYGGIPVPGGGGPMVRCGGQFGAGTVRPLPSNACSCKIGVWFQYSGFGSSSVLQIAQDLRLEIVVDSSLIVDGAITATKIAAGAITAKSLTLTNFTNLIPNANSSGTTPDGSAWPAGSIESAGLGPNSGVNANYFNPPSGGYCRKLSSNASGNNYLNVTPFIPCFPGESYAYGCNAYNTAAPSASGLVIWMQDANGAGGGGYFNTNFTSDGKVSGTFTVPNTLPNGNPPAVMQVWLCVNAGTGQGLFNFLYLYKMADGSLIVDGAISSAKIKAGAITGDMITAGQLTANVIYFSDGFCLNTLEPKESGSDKTAAHALTSKTSLSSDLVLTDQASFVEVTGLGFSVSAAGSADVFNFWYTVLFNSGSPSGKPYTFAIVADGNTASPLASVTFPNSPGVTFPLVFSITGLSAGAHTLKFYYKKSVADGLQSTFGAGSYGIIQRIF